MESSGATRGILCAFRSLKSKPHNETFVRHCPAGILNIDFSVRSLYAKQTFPEALILHDPLWKFSFLRFLESLKTLEMWPLVKNTPYLEGGLWRLQFL